MNLQQTSCLLLLKVLNCLGKLNGGGVVAALSFDSPTLVVAGLLVPVIKWLCFGALGELADRLVL